MAQRDIDDQEWEPVDSEGWKPPTEAEMKVLQARRERSDKISKLMGDYLLKGYKMLGVSCGTCGTILLRSKQDIDYCVACVELDSDTVKDDPALNQEAALRQAAEQSQREDQTGTERLGNLPCLNEVRMQDIPTSYSSSGIHSQRSSCPQPQLSLERDDKQSSCMSDLPHTEMSNKPEDVRARVSSRNTIQNGSVRSPMMTKGHAMFYPVNQCVVQSVEEKMMWASRELAQSNSVEYSKSVCELIKTCGETLRVLQTTGSSEATDEM